MKILIVDDHALIRDALQGVLKKLKRGAVVLEASNSEQALGAIEGHTDISLILLDLNLPDRDGLSLLAELREHHPAIAGSSQCSERVRSGSSWLHSKIRAT
jgi:DNA-binding NarL/FixJ family response regulator